MRLAATEEQYGSVAPPSSIHATGPLLRMRSRMWSSLRVGPRSIRASSITSSACRKRDYSATAHKELYRDLTLSPLAGTYQPGVRFLRLRIYVHRGRVFRAETLRNISLQKITPLDDNLSTARLPK